VIRLAERGIRAVLLDIEGTTTPIAFVHDVLFPFARARLAPYLNAHWDDAEVGEVRRRLAEEYANESLARRPEDRAGLRSDPAGPRTDSDFVEYASQLMDCDRKSPGLKLLQGLIWDDGYRAGALRGQVYDDVPEAIRRWRAAGIDVAIYSSGSELAQRLLFQSTAHGDLTPHIRAFFDTAVGAKIEAASYARIATALGRRPGEILFVSDVTKELEAAREAGMDAVLSIRPGNREQANADAFEVVNSFNQIDPQH
jgi:2,3-diketo-5-methylthio-1-phosphopentane phosphatase